MEVKEVTNKISTSEIIDEKIFDILIKEVKNNLKDIYKKVKETPEFRNAYLLNGKKKKSNDRHLFEERSPEYIKTTKSYSIVNSLTPKIVTTTTTMETKSNCDRNSIRTSNRNSNLSFLPENDFYNFSFGDKVTFPISNNVSDEHQLQSPKSTKTQRHSNDFKSRFGKIFDHFIEKFQ